jgi:hypothetical protein
MGIYLNPRDCSKEQFLDENAIEVNLADAQRHVFGGADVLVILVDNGPFTAAAVATSPQEMNTFLNPNDYRPKQYFIIEKQKIYPLLSPMEQNIVKVA